ncbi:MAG: protein smg-like protein [Betaproteobacteria bacterium HGW-Betaproteobacteria-22]|nr:MAG: protein smg-like protein [Betaproteobacteria bacterium HGW-Betaproteobacteria-22]
MFEVLVYMFENYIDTQFRPDDKTLSKELFAAGFDEDDINGAFDWFNQLEAMTKKSELFQMADPANLRVFTETELKKISGESIGFILFLVQAKILNTSQRELVLELAMNVPQPEITIEEMRWIVLMTTWGASKSGPNKTKDYLFIEDILLNQQKPTQH